VGVADVSAAVVERYLGERRAAGNVNYRSIKAMRPLLSYLAELGILPPKEPAFGPVPALLERYRSYLISERGLTPGTARC
jgi:integrase/recombinase XerD